MRRIFAALVLVLCSFAAHAGEGVYITLDGGYASWNKDDFRARLERQNLGTDPITGLSNANLLLDHQMPNGGIFGLRLGYNIAGYVGIEGNIAVRPYDLFQDTRGGLGMLGLAARWFPLQGFVRSSRQFDLSLSAGMDYFLSGGNGVHGGPGLNTTTDVKLENTGRGFDGLGMEFGVTAELYPARWVSLGITPRMYIVDPLHYFVDYDHRDSGGSIPLSGSGLLTMYSISLSITFHFVPLPE
jgi:hypothetical protein